MSSGRRPGASLPGWLLTIPAAAIVGAAAAGIAHFGVVGVLIDTVIAVIAVLWIFLTSRRVEETDLSNFDAVGEAVNIRGRKRKLRKDRNRKRAEAKRAARREAWEEKQKAKQERRASHERKASESEARRSASASVPAGQGDGKSARSDETGDKGDSK
jgi:PiT family inorganic phosphate transporter